MEQAILDNEVITSPENISKLAKENLNIDFVHYKKSQIKGLSDKEENFNKMNKKTSKKKDKNLTIGVKGQIAKRIEEKRTEIEKLKLLYSNPKSIPQEVKIQVAKQVKEKKVALKNIYQKPTDALDKAQRWGAIQIVKAFLGIPVIPGK